LAVENYTFSCVKWGCIHLSLSC